MAETLSTTFEAESLAGENSTEAGPSPRLSPRQQAFAVAVIYSVAIGVAVWSLGLLLSARYPMAFSELFTGSMVSLGQGNKSLEVMGTSAAIVSAVVTYLIVMKAHDRLHEAGVARAWRQGAQVPVFLALLFVVAGPTGLRSLALGSSYLASLTLPVVLTSIATGFVTAKALQNPKVRLESSSAEDYLRYGPFAVLAVTLALLISAAGLRSLTAMLGWNPPTPLLALTSSALLASALIGAWLLTRRRPDASGLIVTVSLVQALWLAGVAFLAPPPVISSLGDTFTQARWQSGLGLVATAVLLTLGGWQVVRAVVRSLKGRADSPVSAIPLALVGVALSQRLLLPQVSPDGYHFGELISPYTLLADFGQLPYTDQFPARGILVNYLPAMVSSGFLQPWAGLTYVWGFAWLAFAAMAAVWPLLRRRLGWQLGAIVTVVPLGLLAMDSTLLIDVVMLAAVTALGLALLKWPGGWAVPALWVVASVVLVLLAPAQGIVAAGVGGVLLLLPPSRVFRDWGVTTRLLIAAGLTLVICLVIPLVRESLLGSIQYVLQQGGVNAQVWGISWLNSAAGPYPELVRAGVLGALVAFAVVAVRRWPERLSSPQFLLGIGFLGYFALGLPRYLGRIDPGALSRIGAATAVALALAIPILLGRRNASLPFAPILSAAVGCALIAGPLGSGVLWTRATSVTADVGLTSVYEEPGQQQLSRAIVPQQVLDRTARLREVLVAAGATGSMVLDLTNHQTDFAYLDINNPIQSTAVFNITSPQQEAEAVDRLESTNPQVALLNDETQQNDGLSVSLRNPQIYRYTLRNFAPYRCGNSLWGFLPGTEVEGCVEAPESDQAQTWQEALGAPTELGLSPLSWGRSDLSSDSAGPELSVSPGTDSTNPNTTRYEITPRDPFDGSEAGILDVRLTCASNGQASIGWRILGQPAASEPGGEARFTTVPGEASFTIPLDGYPTYYLNQVESITLETPAGCNLVGAVNLRAR